MNILIEDWSLYWVICGRVYRSWPWQAVRSSCQSILIALALKEGRLESGWGWNCKEAAASDWKPGQGNRFYRLRDVSVSVVRSNAIAEWLALCLYHSHSVALLDTLVQQESSETGPIG